ncbi:ROK family protein [Intestinibaculum porci]|jgi:glucokinase|uniref:ROK family protein n=1 Tax=Intestinibaculum porci TaxID=2487118 RepID=UPI000EC06D57|nr:ROK family protein [Intestinibaculum porci]MDD6348445.1 ROK family protein [Intestinibaculum porci]HAN57517.1 sugar kinase [Erysipelotrichaceae bacterium]
MKYYIGIDLGGTNVRALLVDANGETYSEVKESTEKEQGPDYVYTKIVRMIRTLDYDACGGFENVRGIGIGVPGPVDTVKGVMIMASNLPGFEGYPIVDKLKAEFQKPVFLDNDANVAGLAEALLGAGKGYPTVYFITVSTGIGGAFIVDGKLVSGGRGHAGEIGNIIVKPGGYKQGALNAGAAEGECSGTAITRKGQAIFGDAVKHAGNVFDLAAKGNEDAIAIAEEAVNELSTLLADIAHTVDPHCFVLGGGVMKARDYFWDTLNRQFNEKIHVGMRNHIPLLLKKLDDCGAIGAAMLPMSQLGDE